MKIAKLGAHPGSSTATLRTLVVLGVASIWSAGVSPAAAVAQDFEPEVSVGAPVLRVYVGLWTTHFRDIGRGLRQNWLLGVNYRGVYGGTFVNSFGSRSFTAGIQRTVAQGVDGPLVPRAGYRLGLVTGYDARFWSLAGKMPVLPFPQVLGGVDSGRAGLEVGVAPLVATLGPSVRF